MASFLNNPVVEDDIMCQKTMRMIYQSQKKNISDHGTKNWICDLDDGNYEGICAWKCAKYCKPGDLYTDLVCDDSRPLPTICTGPLPVVGIRCTRNDVPPTGVYVDACEGVPLEQLEPKHRVFVMTSVVDHWPSYTRDLMKRRLKDAHNAFVAWLKKSDHNVQRANRHFQFQPSKSMKVYDQGTDKYNAEWINHVRNKLIKEADQQRQGMIDGTYIDQQTNEERQSILNLRLPINRRSGTVNVALSQIIRVRDRSKTQIKMISASPEDIRNTAFVAYLELDDSTFRMCTKTLRVHLQVKSIIFSKMHRESTLNNCILSTVENEMNDTDEDDEKFRDSISDMKTPTKSTEIVGLYRRQESSDEDPQLTDESDDEDEKSRRPINRAEDNEQESGDEDASPPRRRDEDDKRANVRSLRRQGVREKSKQPIEREEEQESGDDDDARSSTGRAAGATKRPAAEDSTEEKRTKTSKSPTTRNRLRDVDNSKKHKILKK